MFDYDRFRVNLILYRKDLNITQETLAEKADISVNNLSQIELGNQKPTTKTVVSLLNAFNTSISAFMKYEEENKEEIIKYIDKDLSIMTNKEKLFLLDLAKIMNER